MKRGRFLRACVPLALLMALSACGGYAQTEHSGVQVYGTVDTGVVHQSR
ncbi:MAG TPA: hypothetical protein VN361_01870 [Oxalicibacterium sp.]|nr:hypothetical protein [Oxalicibacterium sp.]